MMRQPLSIFKDSQFKDLLSSSVLVMAVRALGLVMGLAASVVVARWYGAGATGLVAFINSIALIFGTVSAFGLGSLLMRDLSATKATVEATYKLRFFLKSLLTITLVFFILVVPTIFLISFRLPEFAAQQPFLVVGAVVLMLLFGRTLLVFMNNVSRVVTGVYVFTFFLVLPMFLNLLGVTVWGFWQESNPLAPTLILGGSVIISAMFLLAAITYRLKKAALVEKLLNKKRVKIAELPGSLLLLRKGFSFAVSGVLAMLIIEGNLVIAGFFLPVDELGVYSIAHKLSLLAAFFLTSVNMIAAPRFSRLYTEGENEHLRAYSQRVTSLIFVISLPVILFFFFARDFIIFTAFGSEFMAAAPALAILMLGQAVNAYTGVSNIFLNMTKGERYLARIIAVTALVNTTLVVLLAPKLGIIGPAIALAVSLCFWNISAVIVIRLRSGFWLCWLPFSSGAKR